MGRNKFHISKKPFKSVKKGFHHFTHGLDKSVHKIEGGLKQTEHVAKQVGNVAGKVANTLNDPMVLGALTLAAPELALPAAAIVGGAEAVKGVSKGVQKGAHESRSGIERGRAKSKEVHDSVKYHSQ